MSDNTLLAVVNKLRVDLVEAEARAKDLRAAIRVLEKLAAPARGSSNAAVRLADLPMADAAEVVLRQIGQPRHINEIVSRMLNQKYKYDGSALKLRLSLVGSLDRKTHAGYTFTKPAPATYGLIEWQK